MVPGKPGLGPCDYPGGAVAGGQYPCPEGLTPAALSVHKPQIPRLCPKEEDLGNVLKPGVDSSFPGPSHLLEVAVCAVDPSHRPGFPLIPKNTLLGKILPRTDRQAAGRLRLLSSSQLG